MAVAYRAQGAFPVTSPVGGGDVTITLPAGGAAGDYEILFGICASRGNDIDYGWAPQDQVSGWTQLDGTGQGFDPVFIRQRVAGDSDTVTVFVGGAPGYPSAGLIGYVAYSGAVTFASGWGADRRTAPNVHASSDGMLVRLYTATGLSSTLSAGTANTRVSQTSSGLGLSFDVLLDGGDDAVTGGQDKGTLAATFSGTGSTTSAVSVFLGTNRPPNAPAWVSPADGVSLNRASDQTFTYLFSDPDPADSQSGRDWRISTDGGTTWTETDERTNLLRTITIPAGTYAAGTAAQVQVRTYDQGAAVSPWSPSLHVTFADPGAVTVTSPTSGGTVDAGTAVVQWSFAGQIAYQIRRVADNAGAPVTTTVYYDTGTVNSVNARSAVVPFETNNRAEHVQVRCASDGGGGTLLWADWADVLVHVAYDPPPTATIVLTEDPAGGQILVQVATGSPGAGEVAAVSAAITCRPVDTQIVEWSRSCPVNGVVVFETPVSGVDYEFRVVTTSASASTATTAWVGSATGTPDDSSPLIDGGTPSAPNGVLL